MKTTKTKPNSKSKTGENPSTTDSQKQGFLLPKSLPTITTPDQLISIALEKGHLDQMERLIKMRNDEFARLAKIDFDSAMSRFQGILPEMRKNSHVNYEHKNKQSSTSYSYQDLGNIISNIKGPAAECGLSYEWEQSELSNGDIEVVCIITHVGGHVKRGKPLTAKPDVSGGKEGVHAKASTITYLQRYTLKGILGIAATETDDDGRGGINVQEAQIVRETDGRLPLTEQQMKVAFVKVMSGEKTVADIEVGSILDESQKKSLEKAEESFKAKQK